MSYEKEQARLLRLLEEEDAYVDKVFDDEESQDEEDNLETNLINSDTEQEAESDDESVSSPQKIPRVAAFIGKDGSRWNKHCMNQRVRTRQSNIVLKLPGVNQCAKNAKSILECWNLYFSDDILKIIVENTNKKIDSVKEMYKRDRSAKNTDFIEIKALLGLLYLAGCLKSNRLNTDELWERNGCGVERFWLTMSQQRFRFLLRYVRFDDLLSRNERKVSDKFTPIRELFTIFVDNCKKAYTISEYGTIDEKLEAFRGRCGFKQYIPSKPNKYGLKVFALVDAKTRYTLNLEPYVGLQPEGLYHAKNDPASIVLRLIEPISGTNRNITCDNWFTSFDLIKNLENRKITYVGTVKKNKRELPPEFVNTKNRAVYSSMFGFQENITIVSYVPKKNKNVILASSMHFSDTIDQSTGNKSKPEIITFYNSTKGGVDTVDELCATYNVARNTRRWPMVIFYALMNVAGINAQIIHASNNPSVTIIRREFLKQLAIELMDPQLKRRSLMKNITPAIRQRRLEVAGTSEEVTLPNQQTPVSRKRCHICKNNNTTRYFCKMCKKHLCLKHAEFLCPGC